MNPVRSKLSMKTAGFFKSRTSNGMKLKSNQSGFIPMMIALLAIILAAIVYAYLHVIKSGN
ncbi:MAG TPA: hypothetical protein VJJ78_00115 [Candidatus Saccharimonadales bacterium]|nr:hypothetical protein [Candidatus Saccharimonadales bacterium]